MLIDELDEEDQRAAHEGLEEPKLTIFDLLCKEAQLFEKERTEVKILASHGKLIDFIENSKLKISDINHLYPACTWVDKSDYYKKIILFFKHKYFTEIIFGYHEIGPFRLKEPYKRLFFSVIQTVTKKNRLIRK